MENYRPLYAIIAKLRCFKVQKLGQILCEKRYLFANLVTFKDYTKKKKTKPKT